MHHPDTGAPVGTLHLSLLWLHHLPSLIAQLQADHKAANSNAAGAQLTASPASVVAEETSAAAAPLAEASAASLTALAALAEQP